MSTPARPPGPRLDLRGAVDLSGMTARAARPAAAAPAAPAASPVPSAPGGPGGGAADATGGAPATGGRQVVVDVTDAEFSALVALSSQVPVVVDLWATWCGPCKQLSPVLERLAEEHDGAFLLAKVDVDANPQIAAAFQVQSIPTVVAVLAGQPVPLFQGAHPEAQVRQVLAELLRVAEANGVTGRVPGDDEVAAGPDADGAAAPEPPLPPRHAEAAEALARRDFAAAEAAYRAALAEAPADADARLGLARTGVLRRTDGADPAAARAAAAADPADVEAALVVADLDVVGGHVQDAVDRLVDLVRASAGEDRERVRAHLLELFEVIGPDDPRVAVGRRRLATALF